MSEQMYERKKDFVNHALSRCVASMYPNVCRVAYHTRDTDEGWTCRPRWTPCLRCLGRRYDAIYRT